MIKHLTDSELSLFADGGFPLEKTFAVSRHIALCPDCKQRLEKADPSFFEGIANATANTEKVMNKHFTNEEILTFLKAEAPLKERLKMSAHIRECSECKTKFYAADPQILKQTVLGFLNKEEVQDRPPFFANLGVLVPLGTMAVLALCAIIYVASSSLKQGEDMAFQPNPAENRTAPVQYPPDVTVPTPPGPDSGPNAINPVDIDQAGGDPAGIRTPRNNKAATSATQVAKRLTPQSSGEKPAKARPAISRGTVSESRSSKPQAECAGEDEPIPTVGKGDMEAQPKIRWSSIKGAVKYDLFVSDTSQNLLEDASLDGEATSYDMKTKLDKGKKYKLVVEATMTEGKTVSSRPLYFSIDEDKNPTSIPGTKRSAITRCDNKEKSDDGLKLKPGKN